jgi:hypothetical protein
LQFWDYVKRGIDDQIGPALRSGEKDKAAGLIQLKQKLLGELDTAAPSYAAARKTAFDAFGANNALEAGENFTRMAPTAKTADMKAALAQMTPAQQDIFGRGMASQMAQTALNANARRNVIGMFNSPEMRERLQLGMGAQRANQVEAFLRNESLMDMARTAVGGNSTTLRQTSDALKNSYMGALARGATGPVAGGVAGGAESYRRNGLDPVAIAKGVGYGAATGAALRYGAGRNSAIMEEIANQLTSRDPAVVSQATNRIAKSPALMNMLRQAEIGMASSSARIGADQRPNPMGWNVTRAAQPAYAKGGKVSKPSHEFLVDRLMKLAEKAKKDGKRATAPILNMPDDAVTAALAKAQEAI